MSVLATYPLITTSALVECREFYRRHFEMAAVFEAKWVIMLATRMDGPIGLGFMHPDHPTSPPDSQTFTGRGMILTIQVDDAGAMFEALRRDGAPIVYALHAEAWGQRRFMTRDPSGTLVDVVEQMEPADGYWERYLP